MMSTQTIPSLTPEQRAEMDARFDAEERERTEERERDQRTQRLRDSGAPITRRLRDQIVTYALDETPALLAIDAWLAARRPPALILSGPVGTRKSLAAIAALAERSGRFERARTATARDLTVARRRGPHA